MMASIFNLLLLSTALLPAAHSMPAPNSPPQNYPRPPTNKPLTIEQLQKRQPYDGLPSNSNVTLLYTTLGVGHQNYSCNGTAYVQTSPGDGASALLYDTTWFLESHPAQIRHLAQHCNFQSCSSFPSLISEKTLLGDHYFSAALQPTFNLTRAKGEERVLSGAKEGDEPSPGSPENIDWLFLVANPTNDITRNLKEVYRIDTFRGKPPTTCTSETQKISVPYTAQYWFFD